MSDTAIIIVTGIFNFFLGCVILIRNPRAVINRLFALLALALITWSSFNFLADRATLNNLLFTRLTFASAVLIGVCLYEVSNLFPTGKRINSKKTRRIQWVLGLVMILISLSPFSVPAVTKISDRVELELGSLYFTYILYSIQLFVLLIYNFRKRYKASQSREKAQINLLLAGILLYAAFAILSNLILPLIIDTWSSSKYGPIFTLLFVGFITYAIAKHRLLDIRLIVARSLGYVLSLGLLAVIYGGVTYILTNSVSPFARGDNLAQAVNIAFLIMVAMSYGPVKRFFDKTTNRIFYRDAYDPQVFLDELNKLLVSTIELNILLRRSAEIIENNLKPEFVLFGIKETDKTEERMVSTKSVSFDAKDVQELREITPYIDRKVVITDELEADHEAAKKLLNHHNIAVVVHLTSSLEEHKTGVGYLLLGAKKSGNPYNKQDIRIIDIVANELVIAIQNALRFEEIQAFAITLQEKVNDATRKLARQNEKLKALDETKDEFISMASHQLRTPLTSVKGYLSMVLEGDAGQVSEMQHKLLDQAFVSSQRMVYLIADLLNVSRLRTGKFVLEAVPTNLAEVVEGEASQLHDTAASRKIKLTYNKPATFPTLMLDETKIRQVIMNFMDNAIYYTPSGGTIVAELKDTDKTIEYTVTDDGMGVPKSEQHHLFTKFYRAGNAKKARPDGTGLGLFMAKKVIVAQGGSVIFSSEEGKGSTFGFSFEKAKLQPPSSTSQPAVAEK